MLQGKSGIRSRGRILVFLTLFCSLVLLSTAGAADVSDPGDTSTTSTTASSPPADPPADPQAAPSQTEITPNPAPSPGDDYGASTALSGNQAAIGSPGANGGTG